MLRVGRGKTLIEEVVGRLGFLKEVVISTSDAERASKYSNITGLRAVVDSYPGILGGLLSGLRTLSAEEVFVAGVDMPLLRRTVILHQFGSLQGFEAVVPKHPNGFIEPLHAAIRRTPSVAVLERLRSSRIVRVSELFKALDTRYLPVSELRSLDPQLESFTNVNDEETLRRVLAK